jgi:hypothetical protein
MTKTPESLLDRLRQLLDQEAWERFLSLYTPLLYAWVRCVGSQDQDAADLVQEVFVTLVQVLPTFRFARWPGTGDLGERLEVAGHCRIQRRVQAIEFPVEIGGSFQPGTEVVAALPPHLLAGLAQGRREAVPVSPRWPLQSCNRREQFRDRCKPLPSRDASGCGVWTRRR